MGEAATFWCSGRMLGRSARVCFFLRADTISRMEVRTAGRWVSLARRSSGEEAACTLAATTLAALPSRVCSLNSPMASRSQARADVGGPTTASSLRRLMSQATAACGS